MELWMGSSINDVKLFWTNNPFLLLRLQCCRHKTLDLYTPKTVTSFMDDNGMQLKYDHGSISSTFYKQLLRTQTPKAQKKTVKSSSFFALLGSASAKVARRMLVKLTPGANFINVLQAAFTLTDPKSIKKLLDLTVFFCAFGICERKSCSQKVDEIDTR